LRSVKLSQIAQHEKKPTRKYAVLFAFQL